MLKVHLVNSHDWLNHQLRSNAVPSNEYELVSSYRTADLILFPVPPWPDGRQPERLRLEMLDRLFLFAQGDTALTWAPGMFANARGPDLPRGVAGALYAHPEQVASGQLGKLLDGVVDSTPTALWSFYGSSVTNPELRLRILGLADDEAETCDTTNWSTKSDLDQALAREEFAAAIGRSAFVLCPAGFGPSSHRIFETMRAGRVPVILADQWVPPLGVDWTRCCVRVQESEVARIPELLRTLADGAPEMGAAARATWEMAFAPQTWLRSLVRNAAELRDSDLRDRDRLELFLRATTAREFARRVHERATTSVRR